MVDELYRYFGGKDHYTKEEWEKITAGKFDILEVDTDTCDNKLLEENVSYGRASNMLFRYEISDFDKEIQIRNAETGRLLAKKCWSERAAGGKIIVCD